MMLTHARALDLAATAIDFELPTPERRALGEHLAACSACRGSADALNRDARRLAALPAIPPPFWVADAIGRRRRPLAVGLATAGLLVSGILSAAVIAGSLFSDAPPPRTTPPASLAPTADSPLTPLPYPSIWLNTALRVTAETVVLRQVPSVGGAEVVTARRDYLLVTDGSLRVQADGFEWYHVTILAELPVVQELPRDLHDARGASGWIPIAGASGTVAVPMDARCPSGVALVDVAAMLEAERLACFGARTVEVEGSFECDGCETVTEGVYAPAWLAGGSSAVLRPEAEASASLELHLPPDGQGWPPTGSRLRVRGHFDDPLAATCELSAGTPDFGDPESTISPVDLDSARLLCRQAFVVDAYEVLNGAAGS
jgi:hypothetical protein